MVAKKVKYVVNLVVIAALGWLVPGGGYFWLRQYKRAIVIFFGIALTFLLGIYIGSIGVVSFYKSWAWFIPQAMNSPFVFLLSDRVADGAFEVYGRPAELGQVYTGIAGLLNLLCIISGVHEGHRLMTKEAPK